MLQEEDGLVRSNRDAACGWTFPLHYQAVSGMLGAEKSSFLFIFSFAALFYREYDAQSLQSYALLIIFYTFVCNFCIVTII